MITLGYGRCSCGGHAAWLGLVAVGLAVVPVRVDVYVDGAIGLGWWPPGAEHWVGLLVGADG